MYSNMYWHIFNLVKLYIPGLQEEALTERPTEHQQKEMEELQANVGRMGTSSSGEPLLGGQRISEAYSQVSHDIL